MHREIAELRAEITDLKDMLRSGSSSENERDNRPD